MPLRIKWKERPNHFLKTYLLRKKEEEEIQELNGQKFENIENNRWRVLVHGRIGFIGAFFEYDTIRFLTWIQI